MTTTIRRGASATIAVEAPAGEAPRSGLLLLAVAGTRTSYHLDGGDGGWAAHLTPEQTTALPAGEALAEAQFRYSDGAVAIVPVDGVAVADTITANENARPQTGDEKLLAAAEAALAATAADGTISTVTNDAMSITFESRRDLYAFVQRLRRRVRPRRKLVSS